MAFLLGNESCIDTLRTDLTDIQETINEVLVRCGPIKCYSWKSPDKLASELNIDELIERYTYGEDEVSNQVAHYSLLELIIDRLLLLAYISTNYIEQTTESSLNSANNNKINRLSAGLAIKKYWNKFTFLCSSYKQLNSQIKSNNVKQKNSDDNLRSSISSTDSKSKQTSNGSLQSARKRSNSISKPISNDTSSKSVQTNETAFVPCESCAKVQTNLKQNADQLINMCHYQNITSQVGKFRTSLMANQLVGGWLSGNDLEKWLIEQDKDLNKISKQLEFLTKNNELLKNKLNDNEQIINKMTNNEKDLKKSLKEEQDTREIITKQYEKKLNDQKNELQTRINNLEAELKNLNQLKRNLEEKNESLRNLYENNEKIVIELNETNKVLTNEVDNKTEQRLKVVQLEEEKLVLKKELECLKRELNEKTNDLNTERSKLENLIRSEQSLKLKHETTLELFDKLTADYESLKKKYDYVEDEKRQIIDSSKYKETQIENLKYESEILQNSISNLRLEIKKLKDNETLLIRYPDLYGPMEQLNDEEINVIEDMQNQINANKHRISLLENLNKKLQTSINKINQTKLHSTNLGSETDITIENADETNYFMKPATSSSRAQSASKNLEKSSFNSRPVPLFKLENEINENLIEQNESKLKQNSNIWNQEDSVLSHKSIKSESKQNIFQDLMNKNRNGTTSPNQTKHDSIDSENEEEFDFLKDKHKADKNFLDKLNQINQGTELRIENTDLSLMSSKSSRRGSREINPYLFSPSQISVGNDRNSTPVNPSRVTTHSANHVNRFQLKTPPIPPADKNMEVIVGKGRRVNSASNSARSNLSTTSNNSNKKVDLNNSVKGRPPSGSRINDKITFKCDNCNKKYEDSKNFEIHKIYCTK